MRQYKTLTLSAEISIFFSLLSVSVCAFIYVVMYSAQLSITKYKIEALADASIRSCFSEYCISLLDDYDLLYIDTAYRVSNGGIEQFLNHIAGYIEENLTTEFNSFYKISYVDSDAVSCVFADENNFQSIKRQIRKYVNDKGRNLTYEEALDDYVFDKLSYRSFVKDYSVYEFEIEYLITGEFEEIIIENDDELGQQENGEYQEYTEENTYISDYEYKEILYERLENTSYDLKIERLVDIIEINQKENYSEYFEFSNLLESAEITFYLNGGDKTYEITKNYSFR